MADVIVFSPVRVEPPVMGLFSHALAELDLGGLDVEFWFTDDNTSAASSAELTSFRTQVTSRLLEPGPLGATDYRRDGPTHHWSIPGVDRVTAIKNHAIREFLGTDATHLFFVDADVLVPPDALQHLRSLDAPIVSAVYWTRFEPAQPYLPNVWDTGNYSFHATTSVTRLRDPGHHPVGGLGACTLVAREVLEAGVDFTRLPNLDMAGEDRHFCIRAAAHGFGLLACTCVTPFHVYREDLVDDAIDWIEDGSRPSWFRERWLTDTWAAQLSG